MIPLKALWTDTKECILDLVKKFIFKEYNEDSNLENINIDLSRNQSNYSVKTENGPINRQSENIHLKVKSSKPF